MKRNRILALLLAALLLLSSFGFAEELVDTDFTFTEEGEAEIPAPEAEAPLEAEDDLEAKSNLSDFELEDTEIGVVLMKYNGSDAKVAIDPAWNVVEINVGAFAYNQTLTSITIPKTVKWIEESAFEACTALKSVKIPDSVEEIGEGAFRECTALTSVTLPKGLVEIKSQTFAYCSALKSVKLPTELMAIYEGAFVDCEKLTSITFPVSLRWIAYKAFANSGLKSAKLPKNVEEIGSEVFAGCKNLTSVTLQKEMTIIMDGAFRDCTALKSVTLPDWLFVLGAEAFCGCTSLKSVKMGDCIYEGGFGENIFGGIPKDCKFSVYPGGRVERYCKENGFNYTYRKDVKLTPFRKQYEAKIDDEIYVVPSEDLFDYYYDAEGELIIFRMAPFAVNESTKINVKSSSEKVFKSKEKVETGDAHYEIIKAVGEGSATLTLTLDFCDLEGKSVFKKSASTKVKVSDPKKPTAVKISGAATRVLALNETLELSVAVSPDTADQVVAWKSSSEKVATVDASGVVTAKGKGTATLTATAAYGKVKKSASVKVTVYDPAEFNAAIQGAPDQMMEIDSTMQLSAVTSPAEGVSCEWKSSSEKIATVDQDGLVKGVGEGTATITLTAKLGKTTKKATYKVKVYDPKKPTEVILGVPSAFSLIPAYEVDLAPMVLPYAANENVKWSFTSSAPKVAYVEYNEEYNDCYIMTNQRGTATITVTATTLDGKIKKKATVKVTVKGPCNGG